jgi:hypothetical protein
MDQRVFSYYMDEDDEEMGWFPAIIVEVHEDGSYDLDFDDGDSDFGVPVDEIRPEPKQKTE